MATQEHTETNTPFESMVSCCDNPADDFQQFTSFIMNSLYSSLNIPKTLFGSYRNPFHFLHEFDQWFEFTKRRIADKEPTGQIIVAMLEGDDREPMAYLETNYSSGRADAKRWAAKHS